MSRIIDFAEFKKNRKVVQPPKDEITELLEGSEVVSCPSCSAPAHKFKGEREAEYVFAPEQADHFLEELTETQERQVRQINDRTDEIALQMAMVQTASRDLDIKLSELELRLENEALAGVLSDLVELLKDGKANPEYLIVMAEEILDERRKRDEIGEDDTPQRADGG